MITVPKGKTLTIRSNGVDIMPSGVVLTLDSEVTLSLSSEFGTLLGNTAGKSLSMLSSVFRDLAGVSVSGQFKELGYQLWNGTNPIEFSVNVTLSMKTSGRKDVYEPALTLMKLPLPTDASGLKRDDINQGVGGVGLIAPGPSILTAVGINAEYSTKYSLRCGIIYLPSVVIKKAEPTFSTDVDEFGYPIWCTIVLEMSSIFTATTNQINDFGYQNQEGANV